MLPGPYKLPPIPNLPFYIHPAVFWGLILLAAILLAVFFFRFIFAEPAARANSFFAFFLVVILLIAAYLVFINAPTILKFFKGIIGQIMMRR